MPTMLSQLKISEVSLVESPANKGARVLLVKADKTTGGDDVTTVQISKADHFAAIQKAATAAFPNVTKEKAVSQYLGTPEGGAAYREYRTAKGPSVEREKTDRAVVKSASTSGYEKLARLAVELRKSEPALSFERAFARVYQDPANVETVRLYKSETS